MAEHQLADAIKLASNETPLGPLPSVAKAIETAIEGANRYPDHGAVALRHALAESMGVDRDRVAVGCGSVGLLQQLALAYAGPGDEVAFGWPSFEAYPIVTQLMASDGVAVPLRRQTVHAAALAAAITERTRLVFLANANNPTGTALRTHELLALVDAIPDECLLVVDEAYREFVTGADVPDAVTLLGDRPNVAVLRTFSKAHGLAAIRVGYLIGAPEVVAAIDKALVPFSVNALGQAAALAALGAADELEGRIAQVVSERARVARELRARGFVVPDSQANFVWLPVGSGAAELALALERAGVVTRPFPGAGLRVTMGTRAENDRFLDALGPGPGSAVPALAWLDRLDVVEQRLVRAASLDLAGLTAPDLATGERWDPGQVWAHLAEFGPYWLGQLDGLLDEGRPTTSFGRVKSDPARVAAIATGRTRPPGEHLGAVRRAIDQLRARLCELAPEDWDLVARHAALGELEVAAQLQHFHVGHYEEHADQLDGLVPR